jgi:addiction module RelE/StbE family toxin
MARVSYASRALADLERISDFLSPEGVETQLAALDLIEEAVAVLARHPLIGRLAEHDLRELVISRGKTGYIALYSFEAEQDAVLVLAVRHQREVGYYG